MRVWSPLTLSLMAVMSCHLNPVLAKPTRVNDFKKMTMDLLRKEAFERCQGPFQKPVIAPAPILDPPANGDEGPRAVGMTYQEELAVRTSNFLDRDGFFFSPKPRLALNTLPMDVYFSDPQSDYYIPVTWDRANVDFSSPEIYPPIEKENVPLSARVLTEVVIGHLAPDGGYPQLFDLRSSAYVRFNGYPPQVSGASLRLGAHRVWSLSEGLSERKEFSAPEDFQSPEDFPLIRSIYTAIKDPNTAKAMVLIESELFCGALELEMQAGVASTIVVDGYWYTRNDFFWKKEPNTGFVAYSSMLWMTEKDTPGYDQDEAHDSDTFRARYANGKEAKLELSLPSLPTKLRVHDLSVDGEGAPVTSWALANEDIDPNHYHYFASRIGPMNFNFRASYSVEILESSLKTGVRVFEHWTDGEYLDNIVAMSTLREDIRKAKSVKDYVRFKYRTTAYTPNK